MSFIHDISLGFEVSFQLIETALHALLLLGIKHVEEGDCDNPDLPAMAIPVLELNGTDKLDIIYTYSVTFSPFWEFWESVPEKKWRSRWDYFLESMPSEIQWFSLVNSLIFVLFFTGIICAKTRYTLGKNISSGGLDPADDFIALYGWKALHGDVFRPPGMHMLLSAVLGSGCQIFLAIFGTLVFASVGLLCPPNRGIFLTFAVVLFVCLGFPSGYVSARMYKMFVGEFWKCNVLLAASLFPGLIFGMFLIFNLVLWSKDSSAVVPPRTLATLLAMWFGILFPLTFLGGYLGHKQKSIEKPWRNQRYSQAHSRTENLDQSHNNIYLHSPSIWLHIYSVLLHLE
ncbi:transmembrane 9 super member 2 [Desmophyllum pertusum]|uniref:Transmembrane 9 superfamily member n=1 Tax=Desmophyllum pertusum TaxID=174260 RepID=A0A9W9Z3Y5_9CNID|nr:transmembrane 9 super member 2 [Desmophyllum pertusum]